MLFYSAIILFLYKKCCTFIFFKCLILKNCNAFCYPEGLLKYRVRKDSLQSNKLKNFYWIWKINKQFDPVQSEDNQKIIEQWENNILRMSNSH